MASSTPAKLRGCSATVLQSAWRQRTAHRSAVILQRTARGRSVRRGYGAQLRVHAIYAGVLPDATKLSREEAAHVRETSNSLKADGYGELTSDSVRHVLSALRLRRGDVVCDLGSGAGRFSLQAAAAHPTARSIGVELAASRHAVACDAAARATLPNLALVHGDMLDAVHCSEATIVYVSVILMHSDFVRQLGQMLDRLPNLRVIASLGRRFPPTALATFDERTRPSEVTVSWRNEPVPVHYYDKIGSDGPLAPPPAPEAPASEAQAWAKHLVRHKPGLGDAQSAQQLIQQLKVRRAIFALDFARFGAVYDGPLLQAHARVASVVVVDGVDAAPQGDDAAAEDISDACSKAA